MKQEPTNTVRAALRGAGKMVRLSSPQVPALQTLLRGYPAAGRALALKTRAWVRKRAPGISEYVDPGARIAGYGFGSGYAGMICVIMPTKAGVNLGFYRGAELPDPHGLLEGTGKLHRHIKLHSPADLKRPGLAALFNSALAAWKGRTTPRG